MAEVIKFGNMELEVYYYPETEEPIFRFRDLGLPFGMLERIEADEWWYDNNHELFISELGLYDLLSIDDSETARLWRRVVHEQLIRLRKERELTISEQFEEWDEAASEYYFDESIGKLMRSVTVEGGDVIQVEA